MTDELVESVLAGATVETWVTGALVHVTETSRVIVAARTFTFEAVD